MNPGSRFRRSRFAFTGTMAIVGILAAFPAWLFPMEHAAYAQQPPPNDTVTQIARQRYAEGVKSFDAGRFEEARAAFLQTYALKRHPAVLLNLGQSELKSNHDEDAGTHFQQFLREFTSANPDQRAEAEKGLAEATRKASLLRVSIDAAGADVSIDGTTVGKSPFPDLLFLKPGKHTVYATLQGRSTTSVVETRRGATATVTLTLGGPDAVPPSGAASKGAASKPSSAPVLPPPAVESTADAREAFTHWYTRKPVAWVGTGLAGAGLILGLIGSGGAVSATSAGNDAVALIKTHWSDTHQNQSAPALCGDPNTGAGTYAGYESACKTLRDDISVFHTDVALAAVGWTVFGAAAAGTILYALIDWYPSRGTPPTASTAPTVMLVPMVSRSEQGFGLAGTF